MENADTSPHAECISAALDASSHDSAVAGKGGNVSSVGEYSTYAAHILLSLINRACPELQGPATNSFSIAIRSAKFRSIFAGHQLRGESVLKLLAYIGDAPDSNQQLTNIMVQELTDYCTGILNHVISSWGREAGPWDLDTNCTSHFTKPCAQHKSYWQQWLSSHPPPLSKPLAAPDFNAWAHTEDGVNMSKKRIASFADLRIIKKWASFARRIMKTQDGNSSCKGYIGRVIQRAAAISERRHIRCFTHRLASRAANRAEGRQAQFMQKLLVKMDEMLDRMIERMAVNTRSV